MSRIRKWLLVSLLGASLVRLAAQGLDLTRETGASTVSVINSSFTTIGCPLGRANFVQVFIKTSSTAQIFTVRNTNGSTVEVPSGSTYELGPLRGELAAGQALFDVETADGAATLQVIAQRVQ